VRTFVRVLLTRSHQLPGGARVRLRLPHVGDRRGLVILHERLGAPLEEVRLRRILRFDPRACLSVVATTFHGVTEELVGYAHVGSDRGDQLVVADEAVAPGVSDLLRAALAERTGARHVA
jgi:hypothetical protein